MTGISVVALDNVVNQNEREKETNQLKKASDDHHRARLSHQPNPPSHPQFLFTHDTKYQYLNDALLSYQQSQKQLLLIALDGIYDDLDNIDGDEGVHQTTSTTSLAPPPPPPPPPRIPIDQQLSHLLDHDHNHHHYLHNNIRPFNKIQTADNSCSLTYGLSPIHLHTLLFAHTMVPIFLQIYFTIMRYHQLLPSSIFTYHKEVSFGRYSSETIPHSHVYTIARKSLYNATAAPV
jgi:hypothetical protein